MNLGDNGLKSAGITDEMIRSENFNVTIDGTTYSLSSMPSGEYTIISGQAATESGFNMIYGDVIPCAAGVVMVTQPWHNKEKGKRVIVNYSIQTRSGHFTKFVCKMTKRS